MPIAASSSASPANMPSSCARNRGRETDSANTSSIVRSLTIGSVGSIACTIRRICGASDSTGSADADDDVHVARRELRDPRPLLVEEVQLGARSSR